MERKKTNIKIKDIDFGMRRANLKITTGRKSDYSMESKEEEESDYDADPLLGSKLSSRRRRFRPPQIKTGKEPL